MSVGRRVVFGTPVRSSRPVRHGTGLLTCAQAHRSGRGGGNPCVSGAHLCMTRRESRKLTLVLASGMLLTLLLISYTHAGSGETSSVFAVLFSKTVLTQ